MESMHSHKKLLLIINPIAGKMAARSYDISAMFPPYAVSTYYTINSESTISFVQKNAAFYDLLVCVGGDGTLNNVICGLMQCSKKPLLGYIPCGTTNDFASALGIPKEIPKAAEKILCGTPKMLDVGKFNQRHFTYVASFGAFTESSYKASQATKNRLGHMAYVLEAVRDLPNIRPSRMTVTTKEVTITDDFVFGAVTNTSSIGGLVKISADNSSINDGLFEVLLVRMPQNVIDLQRIVTSLFRQQYNAEYITFMQTDKITFTAESIVPWSLDGEYESGALTVEIENKPCAIQILL